MPRPSSGRDGESTPLLVVGRRDVDGDCDGEGKTSDAAALDAATKAMRVAMMPALGALVFVVAAVLSLPDSGRGRTTRFFRFANSARSPLDGVVGADGGPRRESAPPRSTRYTCSSSSSSPSVRTDLPSFPSYLSHSSPTNPRPITVSYSPRAIQINGSPSVFLSGSVHPVRATESMWNDALDEAVESGLNMVTLYLMWGYHQPLPDQPIDWTLPGGEWDVASAIWEAGCRGLFVHVRIGPYVCAEYNYGGLPEWLPFVYGDECHSTESCDCDNNGTGRERMSMRRPNRPWMNAMQHWAEESIQYLSDHGLWAGQGGPIILAQIENELGDDVDPTTENLIPGWTMQDYADWSGRIAVDLRPDVVWTMCNGLSSNLTINTCNGFGGTGCASNWIETHGQSGRIQIDQPALWTESEMGFQIWGDSPANTSDYFWGRTARDVAGDIVRWFARGGTHLNHYMFWGGYNRGRAAGAGIMNGYATDAVLCPNGERRQPKFDHLGKLQRIIAEVADVFVHASNALGKGVALEYRKLDDPDGPWNIGTKQQAFKHVQAGGNRIVIFAENDSTDDVEVRIPWDDAGSNTTILRMRPWSASILSDGVLLFHSETIEESAMKYRRRTSSHYPIEGWTSWTEPMTPGPNAVVGSRPVEQTRLMLQSNVSSDYALCSTSISVPPGFGLVGNASLCIETQKAVALTVFLNGECGGSAENHEHAEGDITLRISLDLKEHRLDDREHNLSILIESLGFHNLIGRWGASAAPKTKGITGDVWLEGTGEDGRYVRTRLTGKQPWKSRAGLEGQSAMADPPGVSKEKGRRIADLEHSPAPTWYLGHFKTPDELSSSKSLMLDIGEAKVGRGHVWLNGNSLGRFWNITRRGTSNQKLSQRYYHLPDDFLKQDEGVNELLLFSSLGGDPTKMRLVFTWLEPSHTKVLRDEVDFPSACL